MIGPVQRIVLLAKVAAMWSRPPSYFLAPLMRPAFSLELPLIRLRVIAEWRCTTNMVSRPRRMSQSTPLSGTNPPPMVRSDSAYSYIRAGPSYTWRLPIMWMRTKPMRPRPVRAMTHLRPTADW